MNNKEIHLPGEILLARGIRQMRDEGGWKYSGWGLGSKFPILKCVDRVRSTIALISVLMDAIT